MGRAGASAAVRPLLRAATYFAIVWPALVLGVLLGGAVRAVGPAAWLARLFGDAALRSQLVGGLAGAPLMLCSCCVAPVFVAVKERTRRGGAAGALMLASPSLNPAALALTFMLFTTEVALARLVMALLLVFGVSALAARYLPTPEVAYAPCPLEGEGPKGPREALTSFPQEVARLARPTLPGGCWSEPGDAHARNAAGVGRGRAPAHVRAGGRPRRPPAPRLAPRRRQPSAVGDRPCGLVSGEVGPPARAQRAADPGGRRRALGLRGRGP